MDVKRILIVDDDRDILFLLSHSLKRHAPDIEVVTAVDGQAALAELDKKTFQILITDHMMPELTGLRLAESIRAKYPQMRILLMTAYDSKHLLSQYQEVSVDGIIAKPFKMKNVLAMVQSFLGDDEVPMPIVPISNILITAMPDISKLLRALWEESKANIVLLLNTDGRLIESVGDTNHATLNRLASFVADNFLAVTELATLLGDTESSFHSSYFEGDKYNIYTHSVNDEHFLAVVFSANYKPGPIWIYSKRTATKLEKLLTVE